VTSTNYKNVGAWKWCFCQKQITRIHSQNFLFLTNKHENSTAHNTEKVKQTPTKWRLQFLAVLLCPTNWKDKWRVGIWPEIVALGVAIEVQTKPMTFHFDDTQHAVQRRMQWIDAFQLHSDTKSISCRRESLTAATKSFSVEQLSATDWYCCGTRHRHVSLSLLTVLFWQQQAHQTCWNKWRNTNCAGRNDNLNKRINKWVHQQY